MQLSNLVWVDMLLIFLLSCRPWKMSEERQLNLLHVLNCLCLCLFFAFLLMHCFCRACCGRYRDWQSKPFHILNCVLLPLNRRLNHASRHPAFVHPVVDGNEDWICCLCDWPNNVKCCIVNKPTQDKNSCFELPLSFSLYIVTVVRLATDFEKDIRTSFTFWITSPAQV